jgi:hypothetical protein
MRPLHAVLLVAALLGMIGLAMSGEHARYEQSLPAHAPHRLSLGSGPIDT